MYHTQCYNLHSDKYKKFCESVGDKLNENCILCPSFVSSINLILESVININKIKFINIVYYLENNEDLELICECMKKKYNKIRIILCDYKLCINTRSFNYNFIMKDNINKYNNIIFCDYNKLDILSNMRTIFENYFTVINFDEKNKNINNLLKIDKSFKIYDFIIIPLSSYNYSKNSKYLIDKYIILTKDKIIYNLLNEFFFTNNYYISNSIFYN